MFDAAVASGMKTIGLICFFEKKLEDFVSNASYIPVLSALMSPGHLTVSRLSTTDNNGHNPSNSCHPLTTVHLPCPAGTVYSHASSVLGHLGPMPGQKDSGHGFPWSGRRATVAHMAHVWQGVMRRTGTTAYWYHCSYSLLDNSQGPLSLSWNVLQTCCYVTHRL